MTNYLNLATLSACYFCEKKLLFFYMYVRRKINIIDYFQKRERGPKHRLEAF